MRYLFPTKTSIIEFAKRNPCDCYFLFSAQEKDGTIRPSQFHTRRGRPTAAFGYHCQSRFFRCPRPPKSRYNLPNFSFQPQSQIPVPATSPSPQQEALQSVLFTDYVAQWLTLKKQTVKPRTYLEYERMSKCHFLKDFAGVPLKDVTRTKIQEYLFRYIDEGKFRTAEKLHLAFSCIFDLAADDLGFVSPMKKIVLPYHESKKGSALTKAEEKTLVEFCVSHKDNAASSALLVMLYCGLRRSELKSIRTEENFLICTTSKQRQGRVEVERKIPFSPMFRKVLPYVDFEKAKSVNLSTIQTTFKRLFPEHHPHELRYTFITRANVRVQKGNYEKIYRIKAVKYQCIY